MKAYYFCDESSFVNDDFLGVAGVAVPDKRMADIVKRLKEIKTEHNATGEIKWANTRQRGLEVRKAYVTYLAELVKENHAHFHIRFSPLNEYDHDGDRRIFDTVSKAFYQLLLHRAVRYYGKTCKVRIRPDDGECTRRLPEFKEALHTEGQFRYKTPSKCIEDIVCLTSTREPLLHLLDVSLGALTCYRNNRHTRQDVKEPKRELAAHAFAAFGSRDLSRSRDEGIKLSVWNVVPSRRGSGR